MKILRSPQESLGGPEENVSSNSLFSFFIIEMPVLQKLSIFIWFQIPCQPHVIPPAGKMWALIRSDIHANYKNMSPCVPRFASERLTTNFNQSKRTMKIPMQHVFRWKSKFDYNFNQYMKHETNHKLTNSSFVALKNLGKWNSNKVLSMASVVIYIFHSQFHWEKNISAGWFFPYRWTLGHYCNGI